MFISTCSFGSTGSSAVSDYLRECDDIQVLDKFEFTIATAVDGLEDLEFHLMKQTGRQSGSIYAIQRFEKLVESKAKAWEISGGISRQRVNEITEEFLDRITQLKYVGFSPRINRNDNAFIRKYVGDTLIRRKIMPRLERRGIVKTNIDFYPLDEVRVAIRPPEFYEAARAFVCQLLEGMHVDLSRNIVLDQAFCGPDPAKSFPFFPDPYAIVVDRDPRDVYIFAKKKLRSFGRFMPSDTVENFITYYRILREDQPYKQPDPRILSMRFEEMVYDYDAATAKVDGFLGVKNNQHKTVFVPEQSAANTNLIKRFPEFSEDAKIIERELPEYIFHFEAYPEVNNSGKMFYGRAQKRR